jgi:hypothetical protein
VSAETITYNVLAAIPPFDIDLAIRAFGRLSHTPEQRAAYERELFQQHIGDVVAEALKRAETDAQIAIVEPEVTTYAAGYLTRLNAVLNARANTASAFITGGAGFNVRRNDKALGTEDRRAMELREYATKGQQRIYAAIKALETPEQKVAAMAAEAVRLIDRDLVTIAAIECGDMPGFSAKSFVSSTNRLVRSMHRNGFYAATNAVLDHIDRRVNELNITGSFTAKHPIWKLYTEVQS